MCWSGSTTTWPARPPASVTGSAACSPASIPPSNAPSDPGSATPSCWRSSPLRRTGRHRQSRPSQTHRDRESPRTPHGRQTHRRDHDRPRRANGNRPRHDSCGHGAPKTGRQPKNRAPATQNVAEQVEEILDAHSLAAVLTSVPGIDIRTAARSLLEVGDATAFASSAHLAAYAGIAPVTRSSESSIKGGHPARTGNRKLKTRLLPRRVRRPSRPNQPRLLRPQTSRGQRNTPPPSPA